MIIGIDASQANKPERTGTEWYAFYIIQRWMQSNAFQGNHVRLYTQNPLRDDFGPLPENWEVRVLTWPPKIFWTHIRLSLELLFRPIHLLFIPSHTIPLKHPKATLTTVHDIGFETNPELYANASVVHIKSAFVRWMISFLIRMVTGGRYGANELDYQRFGLRYALRHAQMIFTVSEFTKQQIELHFPSHPPLVVAYNGVVQKEFYYPYPKDHVRSIMQTYRLKKYILAIGRIEKKKNSLLLLKAFHSLVKKDSFSDLTLVFAGGEGYGADEVHNYISDHRLENNVRFLGWTPQEHIAPLLAGASIFAFLSAYEGFGVPLIQALAVGTPVVASKLPVFREIADDTIAYTDPEETAVTASRFLNILLKNKDEIAHAGVKRAKSFTWQKTADTIERQIIEILAKKP